MPGESERPASREVEATDNIDVRVGTEVVDGGGDGRLEHLVLRDVASGREETVEAQGLFLMIGARPFTDWLPAEHLVWFVIEAVKRLDTAAFHQRAKLGGVGRRGYDPDMLLTLFVYAEGWLLG